MPTELVILSEAPVTVEVTAGAVAQVAPGAQIVYYRGDEIGQVVDDRAESLLSVYVSRPVVEPREARLVLHNPPERFSLWTDLTVPFGDSTRGRRIAAAIARAVSGAVYERV